VGVVVVHLVALSGAALLLVSGAQHLLHFTRWRAVLVQQDLLPYRSHRLAAALVPALEIAVGLAVLTTVALSGLTAAATAPLLGQALLYLAFTGYLFVLLRQGRAVPCGCLGGTERATPGTAVRSALLGAVSAVAAVSSAVTPGPYSRPGLALLTAGALLAVGTLLIRPTLARSVTAVAS
jgi:hypothetical protein